MKVIYWYCVVDCGWIARSRAQWLGIIRDVNYSLNFVINVK